MASLRFPFWLLGEVPAFPDPSGPHTPRDLFGEAPGPTEDGIVGADIQGEIYFSSLQWGLFFFVWLCVFFYFYFLIKTCFNSCGESVGLEEKRGAHRNWSLEFFRAMVLALSSCNPK